MMESIFAILLLLSAFYLVSKKIGSYSFPGSVIIITFCMLYVWNICGLLVFSQPFTPLHLTYLITVLICFTYAAFLGNNHARRSQESFSRITLKNDYIEKKVWLLNGIGIIGGLLMIFDIRSSVGSSGFVLDNMNDIRGAFADRTTGILGQIGSILFGMALPGLILGMRQWLRMDRHSVRVNSLLLLISIAVMFGVSVSSGGRQAVLEIILVFFAVILYGGIKTFNSKRIKNFAIASISVLVIGTTYMVMVASQRAEYGMAGETFLLNYWDAKYSDWYSPLAEELSPKVTLPLTVIHGYFPYNLAGLAAFSDAIENHSWGGFQGEHILRQFRKLGFEWPFEVTFKPEYDVSNINWPTIFGAMILDFGIFGSIVVMSILGWHVGKQFGLYYYYDIASAYLFTALGFVYIFHSTMYSPFQETLLLYGLIWSVILHIRSSFVKKQAIGI